VLVKIVRRPVSALAFAVLAFAVLAAALLLTIAVLGGTQRAATTVTHAGGRVARAGATLQPARTASAADSVGGGVVAFRSFSDDFVEANDDAVKEHMAREGLTREETKELTYFALVVSESHDWDTVEALTEHAIEDEARRQAWTQMQRRSRQMRDELQGLVASNASEAERWDAIDRIESDYLADYYRLTGMTPELLDQLLRLSVETQSAAETAAAMAPHASVTAPAGANCVKRDPENPRAAPVPVPCP
jgi:hypothetical protein